MSGQLIRAEIGEQFLQWRIHGRLVKERILNGQRVWRRVVADGRFAVKWVQASVRAELAGRAGQAVQVGGIQVVRVQIGQRVGCDAVQRRSVQKLRCRLGALSGVRGVRFNYAVQRAGRVL